MAKQNAINLLDKECAKCDRDADVLYDMAIFDRYPTTSNKQIADVLTNLYSRNRVQYAIMDVFLMHVHRGFLKLDS